MEGLSIVIPLFNEESEAGKVIDKLLALPLAEGAREIIVVNDASTDHSLAAVSSKAGITIINNETNLGYGASLKRGILKAKFDRIAICDADNTYPVEDIPELLAALDGFDMVVGRRKVIVYPEFNWLKQIGRAAIDLLCSYLAGNWIPDINSGLRVFKKDIALRNMDSLCDRFSFTTSITLLVFSQKGKVLYRDIDYCLEPTKRRSKVKMARDGFTTLGMILRLGFQFMTVKAVLLFAVPALVLIALLLIS